MPDCGKCEHKVNNNTDGHCYMFRDKVEGCCQYSPHDEMTLADHAEAWWKEKGNTVPDKHTIEYNEMYEKWHAFAFSDFADEIISR